MAAEEGILRDIQKKLDELEKAIGMIAGAVNKIESLETAELEYVNAIKNMEAQELANLNKIEGLENTELRKFDKIATKKYNDIMSWKSAVWENCPEKKLVDSKKMVLFNCALTGKVCCFENCPKNVQETS